jgi:hypothetical protein
MPTEAVTAKAAVERALARKPEGLKVSEIVEKVMATNGIGLKGKTPAATIAALLSTAAKKDDGFVYKVGPGRYALRG